MSTSPRPRRPTAIISWQKLFDPEAPLTQASCGHLKLATDLIPALRMLQGFGYQLRLLEPCLEDFSDGFATEPLALVSAAIQITHSQGVRWDNDWSKDQPNLHLSLRPWQAIVFDLLKTEVKDPTLDQAKSILLGNSSLAQELAQALGLRLLDTDSWLGVAQSQCLTPRRGQSLRKTQETTLDVRVDLDGRPEDSRIRTGIGFFDHMLDQISRHGGFTISVEAAGDLHVDDHHLVEDTAIALGAAINQALGDLRGVARYGFILPMDESLAFASIDLGGRPMLVFRGDCFAHAGDSTGGGSSVGRMSLEMVPHFFQSISQSLKASLHLGVHGHNRHHQVEGLFKAFGRALGEAVRKQNRLTIPKGIDRLDEPGKERSLGDLQPGDAWALFCAEVGWTSGIPSTKGSLREEKT